MGLIALLDVVDQGVDAHQCWNRDEVTELGIADADEVGEHALQDGNGGQADLSGQFQWLGAGVYSS